MILSEICNELTYFDNLLGVETNRRLVENEYVGVADERLGDTYTLLITL